MTRTPSSVLVWGRGALALAVGLLLVSLLATGTGAVTASSLSTSDTVVVSGTLAPSTVSSATVHLPSDQYVQPARVSASALTIEIAWERGVEARGAGTSSQAILGHGVDRSTFEDARMRITPHRAQPQVLAFGNDTDAPFQTEVASRTGATLQPAGNRSLVQVGASPSAQEAGDAPDVRFWYTARGANVLLTGADRAVVRGSFTVFLHNATMAVSTAEGETWTNWTGREPPDGPAGRYEQRVTLVHVTDGSMTLQARDGLEVLDPRLNLSIDGLVSATSARGRVHAGERALLFDGDPLTMEGQGRLDVSARDPSGSGSGGSAGAESTVLSLNATGPLRVREGPSVEVLSLETPQNDGSRLPLAVAGAVGFAAAGYLAARTRPVSRAVSRLRRWRYETWFTRGQQAASEGAFDEAAEAFERATRVRSEAAVAWYERCLAELEAGRYDEVRRVAKRAREQTDVDELDLLEIEMTAAWYSGSRDAFEASLETLVDRAPDMTASLLGDLGIDEGEIPPEMRSKLPGMGSEEPIDGYV